jgi:hypothetical protein
MSTRSSIKTQLPVAEARHARGLIDTSVVIDLESIDPGDVPGQVAVSAVTLAELAAACHNGLC